MSKVSFYVLFDHINIHDANAISSPITYGFPSIGGFLGAIHALNRKIDDEDEQIHLDGVLIASHYCDVQIYRSDNFKDYTFKLTRNPIGKDGRTKSIIEEGKVHLDVSLVVEVRCSSDAFLYEEAKEKFKKQLKQKLMHQRMAGGTIVSIKNVELYDAYSDPISIIKKLMPAFVLMNANEDLNEILALLKEKKPETTTLDVLIDTAKLNHEPASDSERWQTTSIKHNQGWLVPIHLGYQGISPVYSAGDALEVRDNRMHTHFVESIYGLGKWVFSYRLKEQFKNAFWHYKSISLEENDAFYLFDQNSTQTQL